MGFSLDDHHFEIKQLLAQSELPLEAINNLFLSGEIIYLKNKNRPITPVGIGKCFPTRVNVNIGTSQDSSLLKTELKKVEIAEQFKADTLMDLSIGGNIREIRKKILEVSKLPLGTVPIYECCIQSEKKYGESCFFKMSVDEMLQIIEQHAIDGVDFMTIHAGISMDTVHKIQSEQKRLTGIVSRGGGLIVDWMLRRKEENPFLSHFDDILKIFKNYNIVLSLGDGLRPGCIFDATDHIQIRELLLLGELQQRAIQFGVQVMIEGPGHVPLSQIATNVKLEKNICHGAPFYVLGPLPLDIAPGYDHITAAIGGSIAAAAGADFLCYVTPAEHLRLPSVKDVKNGLIATKIAAKIGDLEKGIQKEWDCNRQMAIYRKALDWQGQKSLAIDPNIIDQYRKSADLADKDTCSMCGSLCPMKRSSKLEI